MNVKPLFKLMVEKKASDLFFAPFSPAKIKIEGKIMPVNKLEMTPKMVKQAAFELMTEEQMDEFNRELEIDFALSEEGLGRFRINVFNQRGNVAMVLRFITSDLPTLDELGMPAQLKDLVMLKRGLISGEDFSLFTITRDPFEAAQVIDDFYRNYHSSRWVGSTYVIRLNKPLSKENLAVLEGEFREIIEPGSQLELTVALPEEQDQPDLVDLPRLVFQFNRRNYGLLKAFLRRLNAF